MVPQKTQDDVSTVEANIEAARATLSTRRGEDVEESGWGSGGIEILLHLHHNIKPGVCSIRVVFIGCWGLISS